MRNRIAHGADYVHTILGRLVSVIIGGYAHSNQFIGPEKYISGMPVILSVTMKNPAARDGVEGAVPVKVPGNWREMFVFSVVDKEGVLRPDLTPRLARQQARSKREEPVEVFKNELHDYWFIDSSTTAQLKGGKRGRSWTLDKTGLHWDVRIG
jgi:hypothetical protein